MRWDMAIAILAGRAELQRQRNALAAQAGGAAGRGGQRTVTRIDSIESLESFMRIGK